ncbi:GIY-YIG nuclease family protein [bacterium]|nr:GIY-YIG nuclease family protein [bacterium]
MNPALPNFYYVYILRNSQRDWTYIGYTSDLPKRISEHISGKCFSTKKYLPLELVYCEAYLSKIDAFEREKKLKHFGSSIAKLKQRIKNSLKGRAG